MEDYMMITTIDQVEQGEKGHLNQEPLIGSKNGLSIKLVKNERVVKEQ